MATTYQPREPKDAAGVNERVGEVTVPGDMVSLEGLMEKARQ